MGTSPLILRPRLLGVCFSIQQTRVPSISPDSNPTSLTSSLAIWLNPFQPLCEQNLGENEVVVFKRKGFEPEIIEGTDPLQICSLYVQVRIQDGISLSFEWRISKFIQYSSIIVPRNPCKGELSLYPRRGLLACRTPSSGSVWKLQSRSLQTRFPQVRLPSLLLSSFLSFSSFSSFSSFLSVKIFVFYSIRLADFLPPEYVNDEGIELKIFQEHLKLQGMTELNAKFRLVSWVKRTQGVGGKAMNWNPWLPQQKREMLEGTLSKWLQCS